MARNNHSVCEVSVAFDVWVATGFGGIWDFVEDIDGEAGQHFSCLGSGERSVEVRFVDVFYGGDVVLESVLVCLYQLFSVLLDIF